MITVIAIGKKHEPWIQPGLERYEKRLQAPNDLKWVLLPHSAREGVQARQEESERIMDKLGKEDYVILLDETGKLLDSTGFSAQLEIARTRGRAIVIVIGGAYGVDDKLKSRADLMWSLSPLVFPHQLVRLILIEQLYRAQTIHSGHPYHHS